MSSAAQFAGALEAHTSQTLARVLQLKVVVASLEGRAAATATDGTSASDSSGQQTTHIFDGLDEIEAGLRVCSTLYGERSLEDLLVAGRRVLETSRALVGQAEDLTALKFGSTAAASCSDAGHDRGMPSGPLPSRGVEAGGYLEDSAVMSPSTFHPVLGPALSPSASEPPTPPSLENAGISAASRALLARVRTPQGVRTYARGADETPVAAALTPEEVERVSIRANYMDDLRTGASPTTPMTPAAKAWVSEHEMALIPSYLRSQITSDDLSFGLRTIASSMKCESYFTERDAQDALEDVPASTVRMILLGLVKVGRVRLASNELYELV